MAHTGSCVCGAVRFTITTPIKETGACHCGMCRKWSGGVFMSVAVPEGGMVLDGSVNRNSKVRLMRDGIEVYSGEIGSLRREAQDAGEVREGFECGIVLKNFRDIKEGDIIEAYTVKEIKRKLEI